MTTVRPPLWTKDFTLICAVHLLMTLAFYATMPVLPLWLNDTMRLSGAAIGAVVACYTGSAIMVRPFAGYCLDRFGRRIVYLPAYFFFGAIFFFYPIAGTAALVALLRIAHGMAWGATMAAASTTSVDLMPAIRRGEGIGLFGMAMTLAMSIGPFVGLFCAARLGYAAPFITGGILSGIGFIGLLTLRVPPVQLSARPISLDALLEKRSLPMAGVVFLCCVPYGSLMNYTALYARSIDHADPGLFFLFLAAGTALARLVGGRVFDRSGPARIMGFAFCLMFAGYISMAYFHAPLTFYASALVLGLGNGMTIPVALAMVNALVPTQRRGAANSTALCGLDLGICCGILLTGHTHDAYGWEVAFLLLALAIAAAALFFYLRALPRYMHGLSANAQ